MSQNNEERTRKNWNKLRKYVYSLYIDTSRKEIKKSEIKKSETKKSYASRRRRATHLKSKEI